MNELLNLNEKHVLVTGASRGIGYAVAQAFVEAGAKVAILANDDGVIEAAKQLSDKGRFSVEPIFCDVSNSRDVSKAFETLDDVFPHIDVLVNNAGFECATPLSSDAPDVIETQVRRLLDVNVTGMFLVTRAAMTRLSNGASIVNTASVWGKSAPAIFSMYAASKHAVIGLTRSWSKELASQNVRVNAVCPGWVATEPALRSLSEMAEDMSLTEAQAWQTIEASQALSGMMQPHDVAGSYLYLASSLSGSVTGQTIVVDRGEIQG